MYLTYRENVRLLNCDLIDEVTEDWTLYTDLGLIGNPVFDWVEETVYCHSTAALMAIKSDFGTCYYNNDGLDLSTVYAVWEMMIDCSMELRHIWVAD